MQTVSSPNPLAGNDFLLSWRIDLMCFNPKIASLPARSLRLTAKADRSEAS